MLVIKEGSGLPQSIPRILIIKVKFYKQIRPNSKPKKGPTINAILANLPTEHVSLMLIKFQRQKAITLLSSASISCTQDDPTKYRNDILD